MIQLLQKYYGYSFYLGALSMLLMTFAVLSALIVTTLVFLLGHQPEYSDEMNGRSSTYIGTRLNDYVLQSNQRQYKDNELRGHNGGWTGRSDVPRYCYSPSLDTIPTRTFLSY